MVVRLQAAQNMTTRLLSLDLGQKGITVVAIHVRPLLSHPYQADRGSVRSQDLCERK